MQTFEDILGQMASFLDAPATRQKSLGQAPRAALLGIPFDSGGSMCGACHAPDRVRSELRELPGREEFFDLGNIWAIPQLLHDQYLNDETLAKCRLALYGDRRESLPVSPLSVAEEVLSTLYQTGNGLRILGLGGDHSVSYPLIKTYLQHKHRQKKNVAILHFDSAPDLSPGQSALGLSAQSWCRSILPHLTSPDQLIQIGICQSESPREYKQEGQGIRQYWAKDLLELSIQELHALGESMAALIRGQGVQELYVSFDISVLSTQYADATSGISGTLTPDHIFIILKKLTSQFPLTGADLVEVSPFLHKGEGINPEPDATLAIAAAMSNFFLMELNTRGKCGQMQILPK